MQKKLANLHQQEILNMEKEFKYKLERIKTLKDKEYEEKYHNQIETLNDDIKENNHSKQQLKSEI